MPINSQLFNNQLLIWNHAAIKIIDIRHFTMQSDDALEGYRLPASSFLFAVQGRASLWLDGRPGIAERFHVAHGGKGCTLSIRDAAPLFEYYLIYYKATIPAALQQQLLASPGQGSPFQAQFSFPPAAPLQLRDQVLGMYAEWTQQGELQKLHVRSLFYAFVYELLRQIKQHHIPLKPADLVFQAISYLQEHYAKPLTLDQLAALLDSSSRHLSRLFKRRTGFSPIEYMLQLRMNKARELLATTDATLQEIAEYIGYPDSYSFAKMFKKHVGTPPARYRQAAAARQLSHAGPDLPSLVARYGIGESLSSRYIDNAYDNHYQYRREGLSSMYRSNKLAATMLLCITLLLSACSTGNTSNGNAGNPGNTSNTGSNTGNTVVHTGQSGNQEAADPAPQTRTISTLKGDVAVPYEPQRVVVLYLLGDVLSLGVQPVGISDIYSGAAFEHAFTDATLLGSWFEPSPEAVLALDPDLIIVPSEETYTQLHQIAPTVYIPYFEMTLEERVQSIGNILNREGEAKELIDSFHAKVEESKQKLQAAGILDKTVSIMEGGKGSMSVVSTKQYGRGSQIIYEYLGMKGPEILQEEIATSTDATGHEVSFEALPEYAGDYIIRSSYEGMADLSDNAVWNSLPAIKEGRLIEIDFGLSYYNDIYSLDKQLDFLVDSLLATAALQS